MPCVWKPSPELPSSTANPSSKARVLGLHAASGLDWAGTFLCVCEVLLAVQCNQPLFAGGFNESTMQNIPTLIPNTLR